MGLSPFPRVGGACSPRVTSYPFNSEYFHVTKPEIHMKDGTVEIEVAYKPLTTTKPQIEDPDQNDKEGGAKVTDLHKGQLFIATPDGNAYVYQLEGKQNPQGIDERIEVEVPCKKSHTQQIPIQNWLPERQRFNVNLSLKEPEPDSEDQNQIKLSYIPKFDLPGKLKRGYKFNIYQYKEAKQLVLQEFENPLTQEVMKVEVQFTFKEPTELAIIKFEAACRQLQKWPIMVQNPLNKAITFSCTSDIPDVYFSHGNSFEIQQNEEKFLDVCFRPVKEGEGSGIVELSCPELGKYPYKCEYLQTPQSHEKTMMFKVTLGSSTVESLKFSTFSKQQQTYTQRIEPSIGQSGKDKEIVESQFTVESKDIKTDAVGENGVPQEQRVEVRYEPSRLTELRAQLILTSSDGGEYRSVLVGYAQPPQPQGPILIKGSGSVDFKNPFHDSVEFSITVDNPIFSLKVPNKQTIESGKTVSIGVDSKGGSVGNKGARLIVSCSRTTPWIFFLRTE